MNHTLQSLLPLLDTPEGLEKLRILTAEADGWIFMAEGRCYMEPYFDEACICDEPPFDYPDSPDAIFAAEERLGLPGDDSIRHIWQDYTEDMLRTLTGMYASHQLAFLTAAQRCILFTLTAQAVRPS